uniref:G_PROTEIN_RECEP_F1_2 domain-containing protein n=1 Tax=Angiostrongylus cantonensis TaxID=6313 RepID=A0A0K0D0Q6_ANGCA
LSGFLMSMTFEGEKHLGFENVACFYYRRLRRILPSYLLVILLSLIASRFTFPLLLQASNWESASCALMFITNIEAAESIRDYAKMLTKASDLFTHTWSVCLEMQFYFIFPLIILIYNSTPFLIANLFLITVGKDLLRSFF